MSSDMVNPENIDCMHPKKYSSDIIIASIVKFKEKQKNSAFQK